MLKRGATGLLVVFLVALVGLASIVYLVTAPNIGLAHKIPKLLPKLPILCPTQVTCNPGQLIGDIDNDGKFSKIDSAYENCIALRATPLPSDLCCVDIPPNPDGQVNIFDVQKVTNLYLKQTPVGNCPQQTTQPTGLVNTILIPTRYGVPNKLKVHDNYLYVVEDFELLIFDISNPSQPVQTGSYSSLQHAFTDIEINNNFAFLTSPSDTLVVVDVTDKRKPNFVTSFGGPQNTYALELNNNYLFLAGYSDGLLIFDIKPQNQGWLKSSTPIQSTSGFKFARTVSTYNNYALVGVWKNVLRVPNELVLFDTTNVFSPVKIDSFNLNDAPTYSYVLNGIAYVIEGTPQDAQLLTFDLSDPNDPLKYLGFYSPQAPDLIEKSVKVVNDKNNNLVALVVIENLNPNSYGYLDIVNTTDPRNPILIQDFEIRNPRQISSAHKSLGKLNDLEVKGDYAYISDELGFLHTVKWQ